LWVQVLPGLPEPSNAVCKRRRFNRELKEFIVPPKKAVRAPVKAKGNIFNRLVNGSRKLIRETIGELKKVSWPTRQEAMYLTRIVIIVIIVVGIYFFFVDSVLTVVFNAVLGIG
jgi:preprotein translocase subunit SecE